jgi:hypothetical protein
MEGDIIKADCPHQDCFQTLTSGPRSVNVGIEANADAAAIAGASDSVNHGIKRATGRLRGSAGYQQRPDPPENRSEHTARQMALGDTACSVWRGRSARFWPVLFLGARENCRFRARPKVLSSWCSAPARGGSSPLGRTIPYSSFRGLFWAASFYFTKNDKPPEKLIDLLLCSQIVAGVRSPR